MSVCLTHLLREGVVLYNNLAIGVVLLYHVVYSHNGNLVLFGGVPGRHVRHLGVSVVLNVDWGSSDVVLIEAFYVSELRHGAGGNGTVAKNMRRNS